MSLLTHPGEPAPELCEKLARSNEAPGGESWQTIGLHEFLENDNRPAFILDLSQAAATLDACYQNSAARSITAWTSTSAHEPNESSEDFARWAWDAAPGEQHLRDGFTWTISILRDRWKIVSGARANSRHASTSRPSSAQRARRQSYTMAVGVMDIVAEENSPSPAKKRKPNEMLGDGSVPTPPGHDWTHQYAPRLMTPHIQMLREHDWSRTPFGPMHTWSSQLRLMVNLLMCDTNPAVLFWGPELAGIYNEPYLPLVAGKHPKSLGEPYQETWSELYNTPDIAKLLDNIWEVGYREGKSTRQNHQPYHLLINDKLEEKYFSLAFLPVLGNDGSVLGYYEPLTDITKDHLEARRQGTVQKVSETTSGVQNLNDFFSKMLDALRANIYDVPFCLMYTVDSEGVKAHRGDNPPTVNNTDFGFAKLEGTVGVQIDEDGRPLALLLEDEQFKSSFRQSCRSGEFLTFDIMPELAENIMNDPPDRGFGDPPTRLIFCPIKPTTQKTTAAVMILGINTRAVLDHEYDTFIRSLIRTISASLASVLLLNIASRQSLEAAHGEKVAKGMLNVAPVGAYLITLKAEIIYANPTWYRLTDYNKFENEQRPMSWMAVIHEDYHPLMLREWELLVREGGSRSFELRLKKEWKGTDPVTQELIVGPMYVLAEASHQSIGDKSYICGCMTDISRQKWAEGREKSRREEAVELKRQQENFIDMTSHEMRNPLSAIFQSADGIIAALTAHQASLLDTLGCKSSIIPNPGTMSPLGGAHRAEDRISYAIEAAGTIALCAQHQKRIVDDVLVLSKVDANLLEISPVDVQPHVMVEKSLRMFAAELASNDARMEIHTEKSFQELEVDWVKLDTSRLLQILINLCTNAIKFTVSGLNRNIRVTIGASLERPDGAQYGLKWMSPGDRGISDPTERQDWGTGQQLYLCFTVQDTGRGMNDEEMKVLFQRFSQASPRTHTQYGGSGLGLFIARLLTQLQGGEVGVTSAPGKGSTFAFYVKVRRTANPPDYGFLDPGEAGRAHTPRSMTIPIHSRPASVSSHKDRMTINVLVVEDNIVNQKVLRRQLQLLNWTVHTADNGQQALDFVKTSRFGKGNETSGIPLSLILMDIEMPVMNGTAATREIRSLQEQGAIVSHIPIIAITANARLEQVSMARASGMDDVVSKPFRIPELVSKVESILEDSQ